MTHEFKTMSHYASKDHMIADLQDEVGRLREALKQCCYCDDPAYRSIEPCISCEALAQTPPESADESKSDYSDLHKAVEVPVDAPQACKHPHIYTAQDGHRFCDECEAYLGEESTPQACEHEPIFSLRGLYYCKKCYARMDAPQSQRDG